MPHSDPARSTASTTISPAGERVIRTRLALYRGIWRAILTIEAPDGHNRQVRCSLHTQDAGLARRKLSWLMKELRL